MQYPSLILIGEKLRCDTQILEIAKHILEIDDSKL